MLSVGVMRRGPVSAAEVEPFHAPYQTITTTSKSSISQIRQLKIAQNIINRVKIVRIHRSLQTKSRESKMGYPKEPSKQNQ
jgi:hypothetical protein